MIFKAIAEKEYERLSPWGRLWCDDSLGWISRKKRSRGETRLAYVWRRERAGALA
jgi:hypothetical protein